MKSLSITIIALILLASVGVNTQATTVKAKTSHDNLSVLSWNVWFDDNSGKTRYPAIIEQIANQRPDVVMLQEVTPMLLSMLKSSALLDDYHVVITGKHYRYQNIVLSRFVPHQTRIIDLDSEMQRKALLVEVMTDSKTSFTFVNVHLESPLRDVKKRIRQIRQIQQQLGDRENIIIAGDFNFGSNSKEDKFIRRQYIDVALTSAFANKPTFDIEHNPLAKQTKYLNENSRRLDRFYLRSKRKPKTVYQLFADKYHPPIKSFLSDHYGVKLEVELK